MLTISHPARRLGVYRDPAPRRTGRRPPRSRTMMSGLGLSAFKDSPARLTQAVIIPSRPAPRTSASNESPTWRIASGGRPSSRTAAPNDGEDGLYDRHASDVTTA